MDSPGSRPAEGHRWRRRRTDWYYIAGRGAHGSQFIRASRTNCQPAESRGMTGKGGKPAGADTVPTVRTACPATKHEKAPEEPARRGTATKARLPFLFAGGAQDVLHLPGLEEPSTHDSRSVFRGRRPVGPEEYAAGFKLDRWERFHHIEGDEDDRAYQRIATLRKHYGPYQGGVKGEPPGAPSTIRIPHTKGTTPDREVVPAESEFAGSDQDGSDQGKVRSPRRRAKGPGRLRR